MKKWIGLLLLTGLLLQGCNTVPAGPTTESIQPETTGAEETTEPTVAQEDPAADGILDVLVIGNSFSTAWPDELNGLLLEAGIKARVYTVYYSGCTIKQHWDWREETTFGQYTLKHHKQEEGYAIGEENVGLQYCLVQQNWDVISLQHHFGGAPAWSYDGSLSACTPYAKDMFDYLRQRFPKTRLVWHQTWAYEVGAEYGNLVIDREYQVRCHQNIRKVSQLVAEESNVSLVVTGDAWDIARGEYGFHDMCRDAGHDGEPGGGQYLNGCVWFESLTGQSCVDSSWRPSYEIDEGRVLQLQQIAHRAVEENQFP